MWRKPSRLFASKRLSDEVLAELLKLDLDEDHDHHVLEQFYAIVITIYMAGRACTAGVEIRHDRITGGHS